MTRRLRILFPGAFLALNTALSAGPAAPASPSAETLAAPMAAPASLSLAASKPAPSSRSLAVPRAAARPAWKNHALGLAVFSTGTWVSYGDLHGFSREDFQGPLERYEFNKILSTAFYGTFFGLPAFLGLPLQWTVNRRADGDVHRIAPGDLETYLGKRLGRVEGRLGLILPAGYDRGLAFTRPEGKGKAGSPWIGPGNVQVTVGAAANPNLTRYSRRWEASGEAKWVLALDDGIAKAGSWGLYPSAKLSFRPDRKWKPGAEFSGHWKSQHWGKGVDLKDAFGRDADWGAGGVGTLFLEHYFRPGLAVGAKAGHSLWGYHGDASYHASLYLLYFPG